MHKNQNEQRKLLNFEFWINGGLSKIGHNYGNRKIDFFQKMSITKDVLLNWYSSMKKKMKGGQKMSQGRNYFRTRFVQTFQGHNAKFFEFHNT